MKKISVIIPVYKVETYLRQCLDSVVNQTYSNLEIIIIDDGSPDNCGKICDEYAARDERIKMVHQDNKGLPAARNVGIGKSTGEWVAFVDSDDWLETDYFRKMASYLEEEQPDILCAGGVYLEHGSKTVFGRLFCEKTVWKENDSREFLFAKILTGCVGKTCSPQEQLVRLGAVWDKIFKASWIREQGLLFDEKDRAWEDTWYSLQAVRHAKTIVGCNCAGYHYRLVQSSVTQGYNSDKAVINHSFAEKIARFFEGETSKYINSVIYAYDIHLIINSLFCYQLHPSNSESRKEIAAEINVMKKMPRFKEAIHSKGYHFLTKRYVVYKFLLKLPWAWPIISLHQTKQYLRNKGLWRQKNH